ncbi:hypothetical protein ES704_00902 [subsurface metagenome]
MRQLHLDNETGFLNWISANSLLSYQRPVELRKGLVREGTFKYITHNNCYCGEETFFAPDEVRDNCYEDYLRKTVSYFVEKDAEKLSPPRAGILVNSRGIDIDTYLLFKEYLENKKGKLTNLELITLLTKSSEGKNIPIPFPQFNQSADCYYKEDWKYYYQDKMSELVSDRGEDGKEIYQDILELNGEDCNLDLDTEDYLSIKKALLLYDWIGSKEIKEIEEEYRIYSGGIRKLGEGFSWLADSLAVVAEDLSWSKKKNQKEIPC